MAANPESVAELTFLDADAAALLCGAERPIVLAPKRAAADRELPGIAPQLATLGVMLPSTPVQWLLFHEAAGRPAGLAWLDAPQPLLLVMSERQPGRRAGRERRCGSPANAWAASPMPFCSMIAGSWSLCDDSVVIPRSARPAPLFVRRARGYTPVALQLAGSGPPVLAVGAISKTRCA